MRGERHAAPPERSLTDTDAEILIHLKNGLDCEQIADVMRRSVVHIRDRVCRSPLIPKEMSRGKFKQSQPVDGPPAVREQREELYPILPTVQAAVRELSGRAEIRFLPDCGYVYLLGGRYVPHTEIMKAAGKAKR